MISATFNGADGTDVSTFGFASGTGLTVLNYSGTGGLHWGGSASGFAPYASALSSIEQWSECVLGPDLRTNAFAGPLLRSDGSPGGDKVWAECTKGTPGHIYPQKRISGTPAYLGGSSLGIAVNLTDGDAVRLEVSASDVVTVYVNSSLVHTYAAETLPTGLYTGVAVQTNYGSAIRSWSSDVLVAPAAPGTPTDLVPSAQTSTTMTLTATPAGSGGTPTSWELEHSPDGTTWTAITPQATAVWNVTYSGVSGHDHWRVRAVNGVGNSGWYSEVIGFANPATGGGGELGTDPVVLSLSPPSLTMIAGESRQIVVTVTSDGDPVEGRTCAAVVTSGPATLTTATDTTPGSSVTTDETNSDGQASFIVTSTGSGRIVIDVT